MDRIKQALSWWRVEHAITKQQSKRSKFSLAQFAAWINAAAVISIALAWPVFGLRQALATGGAIVAIVTLFTWVALTLNAVVAPLERRWSAAKRERRQREIENSPAYQRLSESGKERYRQLIGGDY